jgi:prepilin-type N-terminal cleavage/methylation domain-containing protein
MTTRRTHAAWRPRLATSRHDGFTLMEMLVAMGIMVLVMGGVFAVFNPAMGTFQAQPEAADLQQRLRLAVAGMSDVILQAGAGTYRANAAGPLTNVLAPVMPYRFGSLLSDPRQQTFFRTNTLSVLAVPGDAAESVVTAPVASTLSDIQIGTVTACPPAVAACGFQTGDRALIFDDGGGFDTFTVTGITGGNTLQHANDALSKTYGVGSRVTEISMHTFYLLSTESTGTYQLMHYDGDRTDESLVDNVVGLSFEYLGDPEPPALVRTPSDSTGPWTTYGPKPPALGVDNPDDAWPAGENCAFAVVAGAHSPRLSSLGAGSLVPLTQARLTDGPWCPDINSPNRFDADLLRIRTIRVSVRLQTGVASLRSASSAFTRQGQGRNTTALVPDQEIRFDVAPRNMNLSR